MTTRPDPVEDGPIHDAQVALVKAIWHCICDASSMNVVMSGGEVNTAIRAFRAAIEAEAALRQDTPEDFDTLTVQLENAYNAGRAAGPGPRSFKYGEHEARPLMRPCQSDPRCYRNDGHDGPHAYPDETPPRLCEDIAAPYAADRKERGVL